MFRCLKCDKELSLNKDNLQCKYCGETYKFDKKNNIYFIVDSQQSSLIESINKDWSDHWKATDSIFHKVKQFMRIYMTGPVLSKALKPYLSEAKKVFLEAGSGLSETSTLLDFKHHLYISLDISDVALTKNVNDQIKLQGDLFNIPILPEKIDYIFNVGVHEHYTDEQNKQILKEFHRILNNQGLIILLWPKYFGPLMLVAKIINFSLSILLRKKFEIWPNQINEIINLNITEKLLTESGFCKKSSFVSFFDLFSTQVLIFEKV